MRDYRIYEKSEKIKYIDQEQYYTYHEILDLHLFKPVPFEMKNFSEAVSTTEILMLHPIILSNHKFQYFQILSLTLLLIFSA